MKPPVEIELVRARNRAKSKKWRAAHPDKAKESVKRYVATHPEKRRALAKRWAIQHRDKMLASKRKSEKKRRAANPERQAERQAQWRTTEHGKALNRAKANRWRQRHLAEARERDRQKRVVNRESILAAARRWREKNAGRETARRAARRRLLECAPPFADAEKIKRVYRMAAKLRLEVDHIVPLQSDIVSGLHVWHNLQLLDKSHNVTKSNRAWPDMP